MLGVLWNHARDQAREPREPEDREEAVVADVDELLVRLARGLAEGAESGLTLPSRLCRSAARTLECDGGAITLSYTHAERVTVDTTDDTARMLEEIQDVVGEGPGPEAFTSGSYCRWDVDEMGTPDPRWPLLESESLETLGPLVVHALPVVHGDAVLGVLTVYQEGVDRDIDRDAGLVVARVVGAALIAEGPGDAPGQGPWTERAEVHQATGMVVAQLGIPERDAMALIRAHAYSHEQSIGSSAHAIVATDVSFSTTADQEIEST